MNLSFLFQIGKNRFISIEYSKRFHKERKNQEKSVGLKLIEIDLTPELSEIV
jgi:hypothetical protein